MIQDKMHAPLVYRIFNGVFAVLFVLVVAFTIFANTNSVYEYRWWWLLLCAAGGTLLYFSLYRLSLLVPAPSIQAERVIVIGLFACYILLQWAISWQIRVRPDDTWDFGVVFNYARDYVLHRQLPDDYFLNFANNRGLYVFWCGFFSVLQGFGLTDFTVPAMILNVLSINGSLVLLYFCARHLFGAKQGIFLLLCAFATVPFILYVPVFYTDTLTLVFPIGAAALWLRARRYWLEEKLRGFFTFFCLACAVAALGSVVKITVIIVWIAIALDLLILLKGKYRLHTVLAGAGIVLVILGGCNGLIQISPMLPRYDKNQGIPYTHWIMMGLHGNGGYYDPDYQMTLREQDKTARRDMNVEEIQRRLEEMGPGGVLAHLANKLSYTFGDGTYKAAEKLDIKAVAVSFLHDYVIFTGVRFRFLGYASFAVEAGMLVWMAVGAMQAARRKDDRLTFLRLALFGLTVFLLIWETRSRYLVNYLPLFLLCALDAAPLSNKPCAGDVHDVQLNKLDETEIKIKEQTDGRQKTYTGAEQGGP